MVSLTWALCQSCELSSQLTQQIHNRKPPSSHPEAGSNDDMITELEFTEALSGLSKDTAPGPDRVKYSDIKNLSVHNKSELFRLYEESFATGQVPEDWSHSYLNTSNQSQNREKTIAS